MGAHDCRMAWLRGATSSWAEEELRNLHALLTDQQSQHGQQDREAVLKAIEEGTYWSYYSKSSEGAKKVVKSLWDRVMKSRQPGAGSPPPPEYEEIVTRVAQAKKVWAENATTQGLEERIAEKVFAEALVHMDAEHRHEAFTRMVDVELPGMAAGGQKKLAGSAAGVFGALAVAQASGFGVYLLATTSLGFLTHAVGIVLPFVVYTGMTSVISVVIGPIGWLGALGAFIALWGKDKRNLGLTRVVLYLVVARQAHQFSERPAKTLLERFAEVQREVVQREQVIQELRAEQGRMRDERAKLIALLRRRTWWLGVATTAAVAAAATAGALGLLR